MTPPLALAFDVFGTLVDWRSGIARESAPLLARIGRADLDPARFADQWRARYQPALAKVRDGSRPFVVLDTIHREMLVDLLAEHGIDPAMLDRALLDTWSHAWRRLDPWPDTVAGLTRLKAKFPLVALSNGNVALMVALTRYAGLPFDAILGAEFARAYKPDPATYLGTAAALNVAPAQLCLVAAHHSDLAAARGCGLATAFVHRPLEYGGRPAPDADETQQWGWSAGSLTELAAQLDC